MKQRDRRREARLAASLALLAVVVVVLVAAYAGEGNSGPLHTVRLGTVEVLRPVSGAVSALTRPLEESVDGAFSDEEEMLRRELAEKEANAAKASFLAWENEQLSGLLEGERPAYEYGPLARVIAPVGGQFSKPVVIDRGTEDGIQDDQPVVVGENTLVGRTTNVSRHTAQVMLITDRMFAAGVRIVPPAEFDPASETVPPAVTAEDVPYGQGMLNTNPDGYFGVDFVDQSLRAEEGDYVVTRGQADGRTLLQPPGLYVGTVESSATQDTDQFQKTVVDPATDPASLDLVRVISDWER